MPPNESSTPNFMDEINPQDGTIFQIIGKKRTNGLL